MPSFDISSGVSGLYLTVSYTVGQYDIASNTTPVDVSLSLHHGGLSVGAGTDDCSLWIGGQTFKWTGPDIYSSGGTVALGSHRFSVAHNSDGTWSGKIGGSYRLNITYGGKYIGTISGEQSITLPTIPRASSIGATDAVIGSKTTIVVGRKSSGFTHTIQYIFGSLSGYIDGSGNMVSSPVKMTETTILVTLPAPFYGQIPNARSGTCTLVCRTYSGSTQIGDAQSTTFSAQTSLDTCAPDVSGTVVDTNQATIALTGDSSKLVRFYSTALCTISAAARNSASLAKKQIMGVDVSGSSYSIPEVEATRFQFYAVDSRGYAKSATVVPTVIPYVRLTLNARGYRPQPTDGSGRIELSGQYYSGSFGKVSNALSLRYRVGDLEWVTATPIITDNTYTATLDLTGLDYRQEHTIRLEVTDKLATETVDVVIMQGIPVFDWGKNDFNFNVPLLLNGENILSRIYPVGSIYMSLADTDPADLFGGTWERLKDRFLLAAGDRYSAGATGGEATHKLTTAEMPSHTHSAAVNGGTDNYGRNRTTIGNFAIKTQGYTDGSTIFSAGGGAAHNNMPPYLAVYMWKRTA